MMARTWAGWVPAEHAPGFHQHLLKTGVADYLRQPGCKDVLLLRRDEDGWTQFLLLSVWESMDAVRAFAGDDPNEAVLYPGDEAFELVPDGTAMHYSVLTIEGRTMP